MQVYLSDELHAAVKQRRLPASELLQEAVRAELHRLALMEEAERYMAELEAEVGESTAQEMARAEAIADRILRRRNARQAG